MTVKNVVLIVSDTFRYDNLKCYGGEWVKTPSLDSFAEKAVIFDKAYAASFPTIPHRHDLYTGRYTFTYSKWGPILEGEIVLAQMLRQSGCVTQLIVDTPHMIRDDCNYNKGFDGWIWIRGQENDRYMTSPRNVKLPCDPSKLRHGGRTTMQYLRNVSLRRFEEDYFVAQTMRTAAQWLELNYDQHEKFFLHIDTFDPHEPWDPPRWYVDMYDPEYNGEEVIYPVYGPASLLSENELKRCRALYAAEATLVDRWIGFLLERMEDLGLLDESMIIFTSDHGFYLGEHGLVGKSIIRPLATGYCPLYEEVAHVPLLIYHPEIKGGWHCDALVQPQDITETILDVLGAKSPIPIQGSSLLPLMKGEDVDWREFAVTSPPIIHGPVAGQRITVTTKEWSLIYAGQFEDALKDNLGRKANFERLEEMTGKIQNELYNLRRDPRQENNLFDEERDVAEEIHAKLVDFLSQMGTEEKYLKYWRKI